MPRRKLKSSEIDEAFQRHKGTKLPGPAWKGPHEDGITQSLLGRFLVCRERFRLLVIEGLRPVDTFQPRIEYGQMWHTCEESGDNWPESLKAYCTKLVLKYRTSQEQISHWYEVCKTQYPIYLDWWSKHPDVTSRKVLCPEYVFSVPYKLPSGRVVRLRGKWDSIDAIGVGKNARVYLQENKTKGDIVEQQIKTQLSFDLQTMFYFVALNEYYENAQAGDPIFTRDYGPPAGIRYNVVRRPLSGGKNSIRQHKPTKSNPLGESNEEFYARLGGLISEEPEYYFMRWKVELDTVDISRFCQQFLHPVLEQLCDWWAWINSKNPLFGSYSGFGHFNYVHWRHPYGTYNVLNEGGSSELDEYLATGSTLGLERTSTLFGELE